MSRPWGVRTLALPAAARFSPSLSNRRIAALSAARSTQKEFVGDIVHFLDVVPFEASQKLLERR
jgi:hypothetical protein